MLVDVYMPSIRMVKVNRSVNRTVTLPAWLNAAALERNINFSQVLQDALKWEFILDKGRNLPLIRHFGSSKKRIDLGAIHHKI